MIKKCSMDVLNDVKGHLENGKLSSLYIDQTDSLEYMVRYTTSTEEVGSFSQQSKVLSYLESFMDAYESSKIHMFKLSYSVDDDQVLVKMGIISEEKDTSVEVNSTKEITLEEALDVVKAHLNLDALSSLSTKPKGAKRYAKTTVGEAFDAITKNIRK